MQKSPSGLFFVETTMIKTIVFSLAVLLPSLAKAGCPVGEAEFVSCTLKNGKELACLESDAGSVSFNWSGAPTASSHPHPLLGFPEAQTAALV